MRTTIVLLLLLCAISCSEPARTEVKSNDSLSVLEYSIEDDTTRYNNYRWQFEQVSYESLEDSFLKKALEVYFILDDEKAFTEYACKHENDTSNIEHAKDYSLAFESQLFDSTKHSITRCDGHFICLIDGRVFWGTDGGMPNEEIKRFSVKYNDEYISIPVTAYEDLYQPYGYMGGPFKVHLVNSNNSYVVVILHGSDGAGSYTAAWIFKDGKYIRRVVDSSC